MDNEKQVYVDYLIDKEQIDNLVVPYIYLLTSNGYKVLIKKTLVPDYYLINNKLVVLRDGEDVFYYFVDVPEMTLYFENNKLYINTKSPEDFAE